MLVAYCRLCRHCRNLDEGGCLLSQFYFTRCRYFLGHVACRNLPWQGLTKGEFKIMVLFHSWQDWGVTEQHNAMVFDAETVELADGNETTKVQ